MTSAAEKRVFLVTVTMTDYVTATTPEEAARWGERNMLSGDAHVTSKAEPASLPIPEALEEWAASTPWAAGGLTIDEVDMTVHDWLKRVPPMTSAKREGRGVTLARLRQEHPAFQWTAVRVGASWRYEGDFHGSIDVSVDRLSQGDWVVYGDNGPKPYESWERWYD